MLVVNMEVLNKETLEDLRGGEAKYLLAVLLGHEQLRGYRGPRALRYQQRLIQRGILSRANAPAAGGQE